MREPSWVLVIPVKRLSIAKSRLRGALSGVPHETLALALAQDTVAAAARCARVVVVTDDPAAGRALAGLGAHIEPDRPGAGLNAALSHGAEAATRLAPGSRVAALTADLPALRTGELAAALTSAGQARAFVADAAGTGTTLLIAAPDGPLAPCFGTDSARAHAAGFARSLRAPWYTLRRDVDTASDLADARRLGLGRHTGVLVHRQRHRRAGGNGRTGAGYGAGMQGTVATYDAETRSGTLLLDNGRKVAFPTAAVDAAGLRLLRQGQRVRIERDADGNITLITLPTF